MPRRSERYVSFRVLPIAEARCLTQVPDRRFVPLRLASIADLSRAGVSRYVQCAGAGQGRQKLYGYFGKNRQSSLLVTSRRAG